MRQASRVLLIIAELLFVCALLLPAFENVVLGKVVSWEGWRASALAIWALNDLTKDPAFGLLGVAGLGNIVFIVTPWLLLFRAPSNITLRILSSAIVGAFLMGILVPQAEIAGSPKLLVGYFVWLLAYVVLLGSVMLFQNSKVRHGSNNGAYA